MKVRNRIAYGNGVNGSNGHTKQIPRFPRGEQKKSNTEGYAKVVLKEIGPIKCVGKEWYQYKEGVWQRTDPDIFLPIVWKVLNTRTARNGTNVIEAIRHQSQIRKEDLHGAVRTDPKDSGCFLINCTNGVIRINSEGEAKLEKHSREYMFTLQIESEYREDEKCPRFMEVLRDVLPAKENRVLLLDMATSCLLPDSRFQAMLFCSGSGGNGKGIIWEAIAEAFGSQVVERISYHTICANDRKYVPLLQRKLLNLGTETKAKPIEENDVVKAIVSGEEFAADRMYQDSFRMKTNVKLVFLTNHQIRYEQASNAEARRTRIIHFGKQYETSAQRKLELERSMTEEKHGIFSMLVRRIHRTIKKACLGLGDKISQLVYNRFKCSNNPVIEFQKACLLPEQGSRIIKRDLWKCYQKFSEKFQYSPYKQEAFYKLLYQFFPHYQLDEARHRIKGQQEWVLKNLGFTLYGLELLGADGAAGAVVSYVSPSR